MLRSYRDLTVWQASIDLAEAVYRATSQMPREEQFGLTSQIRRSAASIPANIAEGRTRGQLRVYLNHLSIAKGSLAELETHLLLVSRLGQLQPGVITPMLERAGDIGRMLNGLVRRLRESPPVRPTRGSCTPARPAALKPDT